MDFFGFMKKRVGRPPLSQYEKQRITYKLEPYIKLGLSVRKACLQSGISPSTVYKLLQEDDDFMDKIAGFQNYYSVLVANSTMRILQGIVRKQEKGVELASDDLSFMMWLVTHSKATREEFIHPGERTAAPMYDPELEYRRIVKYIDAQCQAN